MKTLAVDGKGGRQNGLLRLNAQIFLRLTAPERRQYVPIEVTLYSRSNCHLCEVALETLLGLQKELNFDIEKLLIDGDSELEKKYGEQVPVILINGAMHDFFRVDPERFRNSISHLHQ